MGIRLLAFGLLSSPPHHDYEVWLEELAPHAPIDQYWHNRTGEDNADAHLNRQVMGREVVVAVTEGRPDLGTWEHKKERKRIVYPRVTASLLKCLHRNVRISGGMHYGHGRRRRI
jgi:hypothetical protein